MARVHRALPSLPIRESAIRQLRDEGVRVEVRDAKSATGGGFWWPDRRVVDLFGVQKEAAIHELAHAWWEQRRLVGQNAAKLMVAVVKLTEEPDPRYSRARELANHYVYGIVTQKDPNSPTGWWRGMLAEGNDWEMYAGLASGVMGNLDLLPPYLRPFYAEFFEDNAAAPGS